MKTIANKRRYERVKKNREVKKQIRNEGKHKSKKIKTYRKKIVKFP